jgi:hypothetical protein
MRDALPDPKPVHVVLDFGADATSNVGILAAEMKPQIISANQTASVTVTVGATGGDGTSVSATVVAKPLWAAKPESFTASREAPIPAGQTRTAAFEFRDLQPGLHQVEFSLKTPDKLEADNKRYLTFKVGEARRILTITDDRDAAAFWQAAHAVKDEFGCLVVTPEQVELGDGGAAVVRYAPDPRKPDARVSDDLRAFEVVAFLNVVNPHATNPARPGDGTLWDRVRPYLRTGGKLIVMPGPDTNTDPAGYNVANDLMPGQLKKPIVDTRKMNPPPPAQSASSWPAPRDGRNGVTWVFDAKALTHPMLRVVEEWRQQKSNLDILANPRTVRKFWPAEPDREGRVVVFYNDAAKPADRHPAILERVIRDKDNRERGKVVLLTTRMDVMPNDDQWNDYWEEEGSTWFAAFPYLLVRYLAGDTADANFNYATGATVSVPLPRGRIPRDAQVILDGPGIVGNDAIIRPTEKQTEIRLGPPKTSLPGNFALSVERPDRTAIWKDGFSVNAPPEESNLAKVPVEAVEELTGKDRVFAIDRKSTLQDWLTVVMDQPVDLFPWLLIAVLMLFVAEGLTANRFYRRPKP